jgi:hypothetical protein
MCGQRQVSNVLFVVCGGRRTGRRQCRTRFWAVIQIWIAALITSMAISGGAAEAGEENRNDRGQIQLAVGPTLEVEPSVPTEFYVRLGGPTDALPGHSYVQINNLPASVILSEGKKTPAGSWVVPVVMLERLKVTAPTRLPHESEFIILLIAGDGTVLVERTIALYVAPAVVAARTDEKLEETQAPRIATSTALPIASTPVPGPVSTDPPERKGATSAPTKGERAQAERLVSQGERYVAEGNISIARQYFLRAAELGLAIAALKMAETHDPRALEGVNVRGLMPDPVEARKWYERALELGVPEAQARLQRLGRK